MAIPDGIVLPEPSLVWVYQVPRAVSSEFAACFPRWPDLRDTARAMLQENVEIVKAAIDAFNRGDREGTLKDMASDFELDFSRAIGPLRGVYGRDQMSAFLAEVSEIWEAIWFEPEEFIEVREQLVVPWIMHVRGRDGIEAAARVALGFTFRDGAIVRITMYQERQEALDAAALPAVDAPTEGR